MGDKPQSLTKAHDLNAFDCGKEPLTNWLKKYAMQSQSSGHTKTMVITDGNNVVVGYYSYNVCSVEHDASTPERVKKGLAKHTIPVFLIARLAIDSRYQKRGLGGRLMRHVLRRVAAISESVPIRAILVDAMDEEAKAFYRAFNFEPWPSDSLRMWLMMKDLLATLKAETGQAID